MRSCTEEGERRHSREGVGRRGTLLEPDISVICDPKKLTEKGCNGAPDWVIEIVSPSSSGNDYIRKLQLYHSAGVLEYWIVDPGSEMVTVYDLTAKN